MAASATQRQVFIKLFFPGILLRGVAVVCLLFIISAGTAKIGRLPEQSQAGGLRDCSRRSRGSAVRPTPPY